MHVFILIYPVRVLLSFFLKPFNIPDIFDVITHNNNISESVLFLIVQMSVCIWLDSVQTLMAVQWTELEPGVKWSTPFTTGQLTINLLPFCSHLLSFSALIHPGLTKKPIHLCITLHIETQFCWLFNIIHMLLVFVILAFIFIYYF